MYIHAYVPIIRIYMFFDVACIAYYASYMYITYVMQTVRS